jgi:hypothetical protein
VPRKVISYSSWRFAWIDGNAPRKLPQAEEPMKWITAKAIGPRKMSEHFIFLLSFFIVAGGAVAYRRPE